MSILEDNRLIIAETKLLEIENRLIRLLKSVAPQCEPSETLMGLYWQIDNVIAWQKFQLAQNAELFRAAPEKVCPHCGKVI